MKSLYKTLSAPLLVLLSTVPAAYAETGAAASVKDALAQSKINLNLRLRYEYVDQDGISDSADALTLKTRLGAQSGVYQGWSVAGEIDNVSALVEDYNSTDNGKANYPVVADPEGTDVNQFYAKYHQDKLSFTAGRQRINHNNQRFVGGVGWRQNEQTYDGYRLEYQASEQLSFDYSYVFNVNRIFGPSGSKADLHGDLHLANALFKLNKQHKIAAFVYALDFDTAAALSSNTYGVSYNGQFDKVFVNAALASQSDAGDNPNSFTARYSNLELGAKFDAVTLLAGIETLGSDNGVGFSTPLATLHKFQGFTDKFLSTPGAGIEDIYVTAKTKISGVKLSATYHDLSADKGNTDYGSEIDVAAAYSVGKNYDLLLKYADYNSDGFATDTRKLWLQLVAKF